jgi:hypothetical protein
VRHGESPFLRRPHGKRTKQVTGENPELYTGHSFRRSSATLLANAGEGIIGVKQIGGWKSTSVAEQYIEDSVSNKIRLAEKVFTGKKNVSAGSSMSDSVANCVNFTLISNDTQIVERIAIPNFELNNCFI